MINAREKKSLKVSLKDPLLLLHPARIFLFLSFDKQPKSRANETNPTCPPGATSDPPYRGTPGMTGVDSFLTPSRNMGSSPRALRIVGATDRVEIRTELEEALEKLGLCTTSRTSTSSGLSKEAVVSQAKRGRKRKQ